MERFVCGWGTVRRKEIEQDYVQQSSPKVEREMKIIKGVPYRRNFLKNMNDNKTRLKKFFVNNP